MSVARTGPLGTRLISRGISLVPGFHPGCTEPVLAPVERSEGTFQGKVLVVNDQNDKPIRYKKFHATFQEDNERLSLFGEIGTCMFPVPGQYTFQAWFFSQKGEEALKGELPLDVLPYEEGVMAKKSFSRVHIAPLQRVVAEEITDPAEIAEIERMRQRLKETARPVRTRGGVKGTNPTTAAGVLELWRQLPVEERRTLLAQLAAELAPDEQQEFLRAIGQNA